MKTAILTLLTESIGDPDVGSQTLGLFTAETEEEAIEKAMAFAKQAITEWDKDEPDNKMKVREGNLKIETVTKHNTYLFEVTTYLQVNPTNASIW